MTISLYSFIPLMTLLVHLAFAARAILRPHREPASRIAWVVVILILPVVGIGGYLLFGETNVGSRRRRSEAAALRELPAPAAAPGIGAIASPPEIAPRFAALARTALSVNGFAAAGGNSVGLMADSNAAIARMVEDIDRARETVHVCFYIWLTDNNGLKVIEALKRAAARGVVCRIIADSLGSRGLIGSPEWRGMERAGVKTVAALRVGNPLFHLLTGRIDLRNHRKIVVIDNRITYCGSQNCADPEFRVKARFAPWVDVMLRFEGPVARQNQFLFATHWMASVQENLSPLLLAPLPETAGSVIAQVVGTGPTARPSAMPEMFASVIYAAKLELIVTTPYYVPDEFLQASLCASARRGVDTILILPLRNDSRFVAVASQSYYRDLLEAGVRLMAYRDGLLHAKTMTVDGQVALVGSANLDRRSFELNYENNVLIVDAATANVLRDRQMSYIAASQDITLADVESWSTFRRFLNNAAAMMGPLL
ncbi:cardiolipin synthase [Aestuariivirga sp.]|uniref:cardiolipin synthase n=1 Tax=Aestuariivirga sp. TaxID=2650926 RepID=UPI0035935692